MSEIIKFKMTGVCPLLLHNGQLANPMYYYTKELKKISGKRIEVIQDKKRVH